MFALQDEHGDQRRRHETENGTGDPTSPSIPPNSLGNRVMRKKVDMEKLSVIRISRGFASVDSAEPGGHARPPTKTLNKA